MKTDSNAVTITGETWTATMTPEEYAAWVKYDESHPWLSQLPYESELMMFLNHFRRGVDLNKPLSH